MLCSGRIFQAKGSKKEGSKKGSGPILFGTAVAERHMIQRSLLEMEPRQRRIGGICYRSYVAEVSGVLIRAARSGANDAARVPREIRSAVFEAQRACAVWPGGPAGLLRRPCRRSTADHFLSSQRRLATCPQADQHAGDDRAVDLHFDANCCAIHRHLSTDII